MKEEIGPPFFVGQRVIRITNGSEIKKGDIGTVSGITLCNCKRWRISLEEWMTFDDYECNHCGNKSGGLFPFEAKYFAPVKEQYSDLTAEIAASLKQTPETPDRIQVPEKCES